MLLGDANVLDANKFKSPHNFQENFNLAWMYVFYVYTDAIHHLKYFNSPLVVAMCCWAALVFPTYIGLHPYTKGFKFSHNFLNKIGSGLAGCLFSVAFVIPSELCQKSCVLLLFDRRQ